MPVQITTTLPDEDQPVLGNGVEDEVAVDREAAITNNGDVRIQIRETGQSTWDSNAAGYDEQVVTYDTLTTQFTGREDGEEYEVRSRTETDVITGAWTDPVSVVTLFPGSASLSPTAVSPTQVDLAWTDNADNELGQEVIRERRSPDGTTWWPIEVLGDVGPNTEGYTDDTVQPDTEYRYRVRAYTDDTSAESNLTTVTTGALDGVSDTRVPSSGWYVEIDAPSGDTLTPTVLQGVAYPAATNAVPTIEIPVPVSERWTRSELEGQPMRVWEDGIKLPIDTFDGVATGPERYALLGSGGRQLDRYIESVQFDEKEHHLALEELLADTDYTVQVDDPDATVRSDVEIVTVAIVGDTTAFVLPDSLPVSATLDGLRADQTAWVDVEDLGGKTILTSTGDWAAGEAARLDSVGDSVSFTFAPAYAPPADAIEAAFSYSVVGESPGYEVRIDDDVVSSATAGARLPSDDQFDMEWDTTGTTTARDPGSHTVEIEVTEAASGELYIDAIAALDSRYADDTALAPASNETIPEPGPYNPVTVSTQTYTTVEQVVGARVELDIDDTTGAQSITVSNGEETLSASNTEAVDGPFATSGQTYRVDLALDGYGTQSQSPTERPNPQTVTSLDGLADLDDTPILLDRQFRGDLGDIVWEIADDGDFLGEVRADPTARDSARDGLRVEIAPAGAREQTVDRPLVTFDGTETIEDAYDRVVVFGGSERVEGETFVANGIGLLQGLDNSWIKVGSERVTDGSGTVYERNDDYQVDWADGAIELVSGTSMTSGETYTIDYEWRYRGVSTRPDAPADPRTLEEAVPSVTSEREADQVALAIRQDVQDARLGATLTVSRGEPSESLIAALSHPDVPWDGPHDIRERSVVDDGAAVEYRIASRRSAGEVVAELRERFDALADVV